MFDRIGAGLDGGVNSLGAVRMRGHLESHALRLINQGIHFFLR